VGSIKQEREMLALQKERRALFFWTARQSLALVLLLIMVVYAVTSVIAGEPPVVGPLLDLLRLR